MCVVWIVYGHVRADPTLEERAGMHADLVAAYASLFVQRWDQYALQQRDGSYWRRVEPLSLPLLSAHLSGRCTLGTYLLDGESCCSFAIL